MSQKKADKHLAPDLELDIQARVIAVAVRLQLASAVDVSLDPGIDLSPLLEDELQRWREQRPSEDVLLEILASRAVGFERGLLSPSAIQ